MYEQGLRVGRIAFEDGLKYQHDFFLESTPNGILSNARYVSTRSRGKQLLMLSSPFGLVRLLFEPTILFSGSEEQKAYWLPLSRAGKILGSYCQTELDHGTFLRGIETTATFDEDTDEFVIHSPTLSSTKFWPGGLGFSATHAVVMARLLIGTRDHGPAFFVVQLRSTPHGTPLPGLQLGDLGLKMA
jgi:acyl-CoA oxidase